MTRKLSLVGEWNVAKEGGRVVAKSLAGVVLTKGTPSNIPGCSKYIKFVSSYLNS